MVIGQKDLTSSWDAYTSNFLKTEQVKGENQPFVVIDVENYQSEVKNTPRLTLESDQEAYTFDLNVTNSTFCKNVGIKSPRMLIGKKIYFKKVNATNPKTKTEVQSLRIWKVE